MNTFEKAQEVIKLIQKEMNQQRFINAQSLTGYLKILLEQIEADKKAAQIKKLTNV